MAEMKPKYPAKIDRPIFKNALKRKRLFSLFDEDGSHSLIWICGPAGYGKTTLISSYIEHKKTPCIWYQWDSNDKDPATFFYYMNQACLKETPDKTINLPSYTPEYASDPDAFSLRFFEAVFARMTPPSLIVIDNIVNLPEKYFINILMNINSRILSGLKIVVASRSDPPPDLSVLDVQNRMKVIRVSDLRFNFEEFVNVSKTYGLENVSEDSLLQMHEMMEGWVAGLRLMAEGLQRTGVDIAKVDGWDIQHIYNYFSGMIDRQIDDRTKEFLVKTSFLPYITVQDAERLTGYDRCKYVLNYLTYHNFFTVQRNTFPVTYQYHSMFREYLQKMASEILRADQLADVKMCAASILQDSDQYEQGVPLLIDLKDWENLRRLILDNIYDLVGSGRHHLLEEWILSMPENIYSKDPNLQYWLGICKFPFSPGDSRTNFVHGMEQAIIAGDAEMAYRCWSAAVESVIFEFNDLHELDDLIESFDVMHTEFPEYPSKAVEAITSIAMLIALMFRQMEHPMINNWADRAISLALSDGQFNDRIMLALVESMRQYFTGNMFEMKIVIETMVEPFDKRDVWVSMRPLVHYLIAFKNWLFSDLELSLENIEEGLKTAQDIGVHIWDSLLLGQGITSALSHEDITLAQNYLKRMYKGLAKSSKHDKSHYHYLSAWVSYMTQNINLALSHARKACELKVEVGHSVSIGTNRVALAEVLWADGNRKEAMELLEDSRERAETIQSGLLSYICDITEAGFALDSGDRERAVELLKTAFALGNVRGIYNFFWFRKNAMSRLCALAIENKIVVGYAQELIVRHNLVPDSQALDMEDWPWPVKIYTLGRFELVVKGKRVKFTRKGQEKPMLLLMAITAFGGRDIDSYQLIEVLWPDTDGATGQQNLATTLHRLRKIIDIENAVIFSKNTVTLNPEVFWVDIWAVERAMANIGPILESGLNSSEDLSRISPQIERVLDLYRGNFFSHDGIESWSITPRERLRSKYIRNLQQYCSYLTDRCQDRKAVQWYLKALELENLAEELYQGLMVCYHRMGQKADAISTYNRCRQVLSDVLGVEPSPETEKIREAVLKDG